MSGQSIVASRKDHSKKQQKQKKSAKATLIWVERSSNDDSEIRRKAINPKYSRAVTYGKTILPAVAVTLILLLIIWPSLSIEDKRFRITATPEDVLQSNELRMLNPRYVGVDDEDRPYSITATNATQPKGIDDAIDIEQIAADISMGPESWLALLSNAGTYSRDENYLILEDGVSLFHDDGYEIVTRSARVNLEKSEIAGDEPIRAHGPLGTLYAKDGFRIFDNGSRLLLLGKTKLTIYPKPEEDQ